jgi:thiol-disulfide isomerase/thioredoxin
MARLFFLLTLLLAGCAPFGAAATPEPGPAKADKSALRDYGAAPELTNSQWLNTDQPLRLADLRGKVVLLDMWTFGCINCRNTIPSLREWHEKYSSKGLVIIGNHFPEFSYEADLNNLKQAIIDLNIPYPVAQDNEGVTWKSYNNRFWPTLYLIDKRGHIRYQHIGEGAYTITEAAIQELLDEPVPE